ncbi:unnamed protein product [Blepharisma stoltei]|uniref:Uncharacterized protein n=1 Tax=Blepharisma stoltei TaxID=1481888 RepID=A0AAU9JKX7_9CILI|nr:unnamed protein product [Blepharisma stoltei]
MFYPCRPANSSISHYFSPWFLSLLNLHPKKTWFGVKKFKTSSKLWGIDKGIQHMKAPIAQAQSQSKKLQTWCSFPNS